MSLRDLATGAACGAQAGSSSSNPLAALSDAILPKRATPATSFRDQAQANSNNGLTPEEEALIQGRFPHQSAALHRAGPSIPPAPPLADSFVNQRQHHQPWPFAHYAPPRIAPEAGAATDVFEAAFRSSKSGSAAPPPYRPLSHMHRQLPPRFFPVPHPAHQFSAPLPQLQDPAAASSDVEEYLKTLEEQGEQLNNLSISDVTEDAVASSPPQDAQEKGSLETAKEKTDASRSFLNTESWEDEFTSFENEDLTALADTTYEFSPSERFVFSGDVEKYFQRWVHSSVERYEFPQRQSKSGLSAKQLLEEGIKHREGGRLTMAIQCFEEALDRPADDCLPKQLRATAWYLLGLTQADSDDDRRAINALQEGLSEWSSESVGERREDNPYLWQSLIALAVSYTNEQEMGKALRNMSDWFTVWRGRHNVDTESGIPASTLHTDGNGADNLLEDLRVAASQNPRDMDVFVMTGILHNLRHEFEEAAIAFRHAITLRPDDPNIWNKLGATLANGGDQDEALRAYRKAVDVNPALIRAWVNVGTAYSNRGEYSKATRYYLKAICMAEEQQASAGAEKERIMPHVWEFLRTSLTSFGRFDLQHLAEARDLQGLRAHFNL
ncbi:Peroxisome biogenesis protein 5 [Gracilariopsis chorda]|uniref:Peroxisome biogenesis protein 5 n=1 Tax=Gracilariopsis chorda TaxID=448386 RepID=A0A2V3IUP5_9FLOR|nr:Peroxisome biogenesis protein 5 [Gracilariopsis chorda]|eukprot:PXF45843.1 Peroxisome biogenesis protein 5 [Gracilariopsis chorda]